MKKDNPAGPPASTNTDPDAVRMAEESRQRIRERNAARGLQDHDDAIIIDVLQQIRESGSN